MKVYQSLLFTLLLLLCSNLMAQRSLKFNPDSVQRHHALKINLLSPFAFTINLAHEIKISQRQALQQVIGFSNFYTDEGNNKVTNFKGVFYTLDYRLYSRRQKKAWAGTYSNPFIRYNYINHKYYITDTSTNITKNYQELLHGLSLGFSVGHQKIYRNKFLIDYSIGIFSTLPLSNKTLPQEPINKPVDVLTFNSSFWVQGFGIRPVLRFGYLF